MKNVDNKPGIDSLFPNFCENMSSEVANKSVYNQLLPFSEPVYGKNRTESGTKS
jgi:hypothetical protein